MVMPSFFTQAAGLVRQADVLSLHLPQFDAAGVALLGRASRKPTTLTYHCDLSLPPGALNRIANGVLDTLNHAAGHAAHRIVAYTRDFAEHSRFLSRFAHKVDVIPPPVDMTPPTPEAVRAFRDRHGIAAGTPVIGMAARLATEKGVEVLLDALAGIAAVHPDARVLFAGQHENVLGEAPYARRLAPLLARVRDRWTFLGMLPQAEMPAFFGSLDVLVVPSLNSTESFGMVQVEAMLCGTPSVASALPGVRQPVMETGMGQIVPVGDASALADAVLRVLAHPDEYRRPRAEIAARFSIARTVGGYEQLFDRLRGVAG
jgi:glycosyltransferase involved in cell wall biosynthesis